MMKNFAIIFVCLFLISRYSVAGRILDIQSGDNNVECCSTCIYVPGIGCVDPSDPSVRPTLIKQILKDIRSNKTECCSTCIYVPGIGCVDPSDPSVRPTLIKTLLSIKENKNAKCCSTCFYVPGIGCVDPSDPSVRPTDES